VEEPTTPEPPDELDAARELVAATELFPQDDVAASRAAGNSLIARLRALITHIRRR
jgi:hypothetical protein